MAQSQVLARIFLSLLMLIGAIAGAQAAAATGDSAPAGRRLAIVVGNSAYQSGKLERLANASRDAQRISEALQRLNFEVLTATDASAESFNRLLGDAEVKLPGTSALLVFYAGHGVQMRGENYLLPVDTPDPDSIDKLTERAVRLNEVIARFASRDRPTFIFLDACRNNPAGDAAGPDGLAQMEVGENTFVAFATKPGNVTLDGSGENSPFTTALLKNVEIPGLDISDMMIRVRNETEALTVGRQVPWDQSNLREQFYFTEQQEIDPSTLSVSLSRILADPAAKAKLQMELASNDLQTAVLIVGQTLRSVDVGADGGAAGPTGTQVASLDPSMNLEGARQSVVSDLGTLIVGSTSPNEGAEEARTDLARSVQTELRRLGCYRMTVDGDWGRGSQRALSDFYRNTKREGATEPSVELLGDLFLHSGRICKEPVIVKKQPPKMAVASDDDGSSSRKSSASKGRSKPASSAAQRPAAPPPDISGGIGIGGIF